MRQSPTAGTYTNILEAGDDSPAHSLAAAAFTANRVKRIAAVRLVRDAVLGLSCNLAFSYYQAAWHGQLLPSEAPVHGHRGRLRRRAHNEPSALLCPACAASLKPDAKLPSHRIAQGLALNRLRAVLKG